VEDIYQLFQRLHKPSYHHIYETLRHDFFPENAASSEGQNKFLYDNENYMSYTSSK